MKFLFCLLISLVVAVFSVRAANESKVTVTIHPDGSSQIRTETTQPRMMIEQQIKMLERFGGGGMPEVDPDAATPPSPAGKPEKPLTDAELTAKLRDGALAQFDGGESSNEIEAVEVTKDAVRSVHTQTLDTLDQLFSEGLPAWYQSGISFSNIRLEKNASGQLALTINPQKQQRQFSKASRRMLKMQGGSTEFRLVFPGKVVSSTFSNLQDNATWFKLDPANDASLDAADKMSREPIVVIAELNGLTLDKPIDSKTARRSRRNGADGTGLTVTDAGPGFIAEASDVTVSTIHVFPGADKWMETHGDALGKAGVVVQAKLFAPKGRTMLSVSDVQVLSAMDDKGRSVAPAKDEGDGEAPEITNFRNGAGGDPVQTTISLQLALPEKDAQSIQDLSGEAVAVTVGKWRELVITNKAGEIDLSSLVPGAKMTIGKITVNPGRITAPLEIKGPPEIRRLEVKGVVPGAQQFGVGNNVAMESSYIAHGATPVRKLRLQVFAVDPQGNKPSADNLKITVRYPDDLHRERVKFKLSNLDLY